MESQESFMLGTYAIKVTQFEKTGSIGNFITPLGNKNKFVFKLYALHECIKHRSTFEERQLGRTLKAIQPVQSAAKSKKLNSLSKLKGFQLLSRHLCFPK